MGEVVGGFWVGLGALDSQILTVRMEDFGDRLGDLANRLPLLVGAANDLVVYVRQVHHLPDLPPAKTQHPPQQVDKQKRAEVPEVRRVVDGGPATIDANGLAIGGTERLDRSGERVVETELGHSRSRGGLRGAGGKVLEC